MSDNKHDDGGFAFPWTSIRDGTTNEWCAGMTLLDWFAGQIARSAYQMQQDHGLSPREIAEECYRMAEAMVAEKRRREHGSNNESRMSSAESADREAAAGSLPSRWCSAEDTSQDVLERIKVALRIPGTDRNYVEWASECRDAYDDLDRVRKRIFEIESRLKSARRLLEMWKGCRGKDKFYPFSSTIKWLSGTP